MKTFIQNLKPHKLPNRIDRSLLQNFAGTVQGQLIATLRFFDLIDGKGIPTEALERLHQAYDTDQWPFVLGDVLRKSYPAIFEIGLASASPGQFNEAFRNAFGGAEAVQRKSRTFFLNAARDAEIEISGLITKNKKPRSAAAAGRRRSPRAAKVVASNPERTITPPPPRASNDGVPPKPPIAYELLAVLDMSDMQPMDQTAVWTLNSVSEEEGSGHRIHDETAAGHLKAFRRCASYRSQGGTGWNRLSRVGGFRAVREVMAPVPLAAP